MDGGTSRRVRGPDGETLVTRSASLIVARLGRENADRLSSIVGGTRLHVPGNLANAGRLKRLLGDDLAVLVVLHFGDSRLSVPLTNDGPGGARTRVDLRRIKRLANRGWSSARIARELKCSERTVDAKRALLRSRARTNVTTIGDDGVPTHDE